MNNALYPDQYGFCAGHSMEMASIRDLGMIKEACEGGQSVIAVMMDLSKAVDTLAHSILLDSNHMEL